MYEKYGLMVKVTNPDVIQYLRSNPEETNKSLIEAALRDMLGIPPQPPQIRFKGKGKALPDNVNSIPVKISDQYLIDYICQQKQRFGVCQRHTVETAVLRYMERIKNDADK